MTRILGKAKNYFLIAVLFILAVVFVLPIIIVFTNSFMGMFEIVNRYTADVGPGNIEYATVVHTGAYIHYVRMTLIPTFVSFEQYFNLFIRSPNYISRFWNSIALALPILIGTVLFSAPAAYAFHLSRLRFKEVIYVIYIIVVLMPLQVAIVPNFIVASWFGIEESRLAIILPAIVSPLGVLILRQFLRTLTMDYIEAAQIDGASEVRIIVSIVMPMFKPALAALVILTMAESWNLVEQPLIFLSNDQLPLSVYLAHMAIHNLDVIFAASFFFLLPPVLVFMYYKEHLAEGIVLSGVK